MVCHFGWSIIRGETETGLTIFRPNDGLDEGDIVLQKRTPIGADDTLGTVYFDRLFPMAVEAMLEAADLILAASTAKRSRTRRWPATRAGAATPRRGSTGRPMRRTSTI